MSKIAVVSGDAVAVEAAPNPLFMAFELFKLDIRIVQNVTKKIATETPPSGTF